ncbi:MAG TPA: PilX N-terminal domain-containing pilus assembly protein [Candidatus Binatia bacterium]|jgi:hypothetical protein|nr:PilX N-terminal domain-containing pilus assembly protein [Candidatus Binatia bacterium]
MRRKGQDGFALIAVLVVMLLLMAISGAMHTSVISETYLRGGHARATAGFYAAEAGINRGMGDYRNIFLAYRQPRDADDDFDEKTLALGDRTVRYHLTPAALPPGVPSWPVIERVPAGQPFAGLNSQLYSYVAQSTSEVNEGDVEVSLGTQFDVNYIPLFQFLAFYEDDLEINPGPTMTLNGPIHTNGSLYINTNNSLFIQDLPPSIPSVSVTARNSFYRGRKDIQNTPRCGGTVTIDTLADTAAPLHDLDPRNVTCASSTSATSQTDAQLAPWLGAIKARQPYVAVPSPDVLTRGAGQYWELADLRLALDLEHGDGSPPRYPIVVLNAADGIDATRTAALNTFMHAKPGAVFYNDVPRAGFDVASEACTGTSYCNNANYSPTFSSVQKVYACAWSDLNLYSACTAPYAMEQTALSGGRWAYRRGGFYNNREQKWVYMLNVNLRDLLAWNRGVGGHALIDNPDDETEGGLVIYLTVKGPLSTGATLDSRLRYGVRVFGSRDLDFPAKADPTGVTVVSDQAIYIEGDYNVNVAQPNYNAIRPKQPAAFMGDSINVLSNAWSGNPLDGVWWIPNGGMSGCRNDCQSRRSLLASGSWHEARPAATTYINAAFLGGVDRTLAASATGYNGGFENYPRFHEKWSNGSSLVYRGSFVSLGTPRRANGLWCGTAGSLAGGCNIYDAPIRAWNYDPDFQEVKNLPPITPRVVSVQQVLFTENFR